MEKNYKIEAIKLLRANKWTYDMIGKAFGLSRQRIHQKENEKLTLNKVKISNGELRMRIMDTLPENLKEQIDYLSTCEHRRKSIIHEKAGVVKRLRDEFSLSFPEIGLLLRRDHSTIMHHYQSSIGS